MEPSREGEGLCSQPDLGGWDNSPDTACLGGLAQEIPYVASPGVGPA
jgi:hypothetical protein